MLFHDRTRSYLIGGNIRSRDQEKLQARWLLLLRRLLPTIRHALTVNRMISGLAAESFVQSQGGAPGETGLVLLDSRGRIAALDGAAERALSGGVCRLDQQSQLSLTEPHAQDWLQRQLRFLARGLAPPEPELRALTVNRQVTTYRISLVTDYRMVPPPIWPGAYIPGRLCALLVERPRPAARRETALREEFGLTEAEAQVVLALADGERTDVIADSRGVSIHTVRRQIKSAMQKCEVSRQTQMVAKVLSLMVARPEQGSGPSPGAKGR